MGRLAIVDSTAAEQRAAAAGQVGSIDGWVVAPAGPGTQDSTAVEEAEFDSRVDFLEMVVSAVADSSSVVRPTGYPEVSPGKASMRPTGQWTVVADC